MLSYIRQDFLCRHEQPLPMWKDKRALVTGHTGFKGTWLCSILLQWGARVAGFSLEPDPETQKLYPNSKLDGRMKSYIGNLSDFRAMDSCLREFKPQFIFHLAAQSLVRPSYADPLTTFQTNVMGTANLLESSRTLKELEGVVIITSDKCYENRNWLFPYRETDRLGGHDPYSASKACAELVTASFRDSYFRDAGIPLATARAGNVIGGGDFALDRLVPDAIRAFQAGEPLEIRSPEATRPWQHVLDPLAGYLRLAEALLARKPFAESAFNFGPEGEASVRTVTTKIAKFWGGDPEISAPPAPTDAPHEASRLHVASDKAKALLSWSPRWGLDTAVEKTTAFYKNWLGGEDAGALIDRDIADYFADEGSAP